MVTVTVKQEFSGKHHGGYDMLVTFSTGEVRRYLALPSKVAEALSREGFSMVKASYFTYTGSKAEAAKAA